MEESGMNRRSVSQVVNSVILLLTAAACSDGVGPMLQTPTLSQAETNQVAGEATEPGQDLSHVGRFAVRATVAGDFRPGGLIQVTATVRANFPTKDAEIRIEAPEIQLLKTGAFSRGGRITGITISPEASERAITLAIGTARTLHTTLTVSEPGYYRVLVGGRAPNESPIAQGKTVQNVVYDEVWFTVVDQGGRVTGGYDVSAYPSGVIPQPGPFRGSVQSSPEANKPASAAIVTESAVQTVLTNDPMTLQVSYYNRDASAFEPLVDARYRLVVTSGGSSTTYTGQLNSNGEFAFPCATSPTAGGMLDVWYESPGRVSVIRHGTVGTLTLHYAISVTLCGSYTSAGVDQSLNGNAAARVFTNALIGVNTSRTLFPTRATISYKMSTIVPDTYYSKSDDRIQIDTGATWGSYGIFAAAHEYGHALHHTALGGIKTNSGTCGEEHFYDGTTTMVAPTAKDSRITTPQLLGGLLEISLFKLGTDLITKDRTEPRMREGLRRFCMI